MTSSDEPQHPDHDQDAFEAPRAPGNVSAEAESVVAPEGPAHPIRPYAVLQYPDFRRYIAGSLISNIGMQMLSVAVAWQLFKLTNSALALGLVGLVQIVPVIGLAMLAGQLADMHSRRRIVLLTTAVMCATAATLAILSSRGSTLDLPMLDGLSRGLEHLAHAMGEQQAHVTSGLVPILYLVLLVLGVARAFHGPARTALLPQLVPIEAFSNAVTWNSSAWQTAAMVGPALGGLIIARFADTPYQYSVVYALAAVSVVVLFAFIFTIPDRGVPGTAHKEPVTLHSLSAGVRFVFDHKIILATITLDLFAVLLGGATALLPVFADRILHCGPFGLGCLRAAPSVGALAMAAYLAHRPPMRRAGPALVTAVAGFGVATIVFGLSRSFWLSLGALVVTGALDNISVVVRHTLVQVLTPDTMRGRVSAVNQVFIGISNEMGELESGVTAALLGPVGSVLLGGLGTIAVVAAVSVIWPQVPRFGSLADAKPVEG